LHLSSLIRKAWKTDAVITAYVYGEFGHGKTAYALWTAYEVLGDWGKVLNHLFFDPSEAIRVMDKAIESGERLKVIIMDDAGLWLDRLTWWEEDKVAFMEFFNLIRSVAAGVIFTTPSEELPKQLLKKCFFRVSVRPTTREEVVKLAGEEAYNSLVEAAESLGIKPYINLAVGYRLKTLPSFMEFVRKDYYDIYLLHYPVYEEYTKKRQAALKQYFSKWREKVESMKMKNRDTLIQLAKDMLHKGRDKNEIVKELIKAGIPRSTAYRWLKRLESLNTPISGFNQA